MITKEEETEVQAGEVISTKVVNPEGFEGGFFALCLHSSSDFIFNLPKEHSECPEVESTTSKAVLIYMKPGADLFLYVIIMDKDGEKSLLLATIGVTVCILCTDSTVANKCQNVSAPVKKEAGKLWRGYLGIACYAIVPDCLGRT